MKTCPHDFVPALCVACNPTLSYRDTPSYAQLTVRIDRKGFTVIFDPGTGQSSQFWGANTKAHSETARRLALSHLVDIEQTARSLKRE